jgi:hypothetical protein
MRERIDRETADAVRTAGAGGSGGHEDRAPSATWTYTVNDNSFEENLGLSLVGNRNIGFSVWAAFFNWPFLLIALLWRRFSGKKG